jgi:recombination protein RecT
MTKALAKKPIDRLKAMISAPSVQKQFKNAMGKNSDLFVASLIDAYGADSYLQKLNDPSGVISEALKAATLKLPISKALGFAYLVPYKNKPTFILGYKGMIQLAMRSGQLKTLNADIVYDGEFQKFDRVAGKLDISGERKSDEVEGYFVFMELINPYDPKLPGFQKIEYWTKERVISHAEEKSPSYKNKRSAWFSDFDAMAKKTVLRSLLSKYAPMSIEFVNIIAQDEVEEPETKNLNLDPDMAESEPNGDKIQSAPQDNAPELEDISDFEPEPGF